MTDNPTAGTGGTIGLSTEGTVQWLIFDRPAKHNALSMAMTEQALDAVRTFSAGGEQRVLVLAGAGDRAFVSGGDLSEFDKEHDADNAERRYSVDFAKWIVDLVGPSAACEILYTGQRYDSAEAAGLGLVNRVYPKAALESEVARIAGTIAGNAPLSVRATKQTIRYLLRDSGDGDRLACEEAIAACPDSRDFAEGRAAYAEKRKPVFEGR